MSNCLHKWQKFDEKTFEPIFDPKYGFNFNGNVTNLDQLVSHKHYIIYQCKYCGKLHKELILAGKEICSKR